MLFSLNFYHFFLLLGPNILLSTLFPNTLSLCSCPKSRNFRAQLRIRWFVFVKVLEGTFRIYIFYFVFLGFEMGGTEEPNIWYVFITAL
jgi:hypothetical protein